MVFLGRNEKGQLGVKDLLRRDIPTPIEGLPPHAIVNAATGRAHTLLLTGKFIHILQKIYNYCIYVKLLSYEYICNITTCAS